MRAALVLCLLYPIVAGAEPEPMPQKPGETYVYQPAGRRDPFQSLQVTGIEPRVPPKRGEGAAGIMVDEIAVKGVLQSGRTMVAMVAGPDGKHHIIRPGDKFMDGIVKTVIPQGLVIVQDISDPLSLDKQREVRKLLRSKEEPKP